jgi:hypothetical protein
VGRAYTYHLYLLPILTTAVGAHLGLACLHPPAWERRRRRRQQGRARLCSCGANGDEVEGALAEEGLEVRMHLASRPARRPKGEHV